MTEPGHFRALTKPYSVDKRSNLPPNPKCPRREITLALIASMSERDHARVMPMNINARIFTYYFSASPKSCKNSRTQALPEHRLHSGRKIFFMGLETLSIASTYKTMKNHVQKHIPQTLSSRLIQRTLGISIYTCQSEFSEFVSQLQSRQSIWGSTKLQKRPQALTSD